MNKVVSIRLPKTLVKELQTLAKENHYLDLSEQIRDVLRIKLYEKLTVQETVTEPTSNKTKIIAELQKMLRELENE